MSDWGDEETTTTTTYQKETNNDDDWGGPSADNNDNDDGSQNGDGGNRFGGGRGRGRGGGRGGRGGGGRGGGRSYNDENSDGGFPRRRFNRDNNDEENGGENLTFMEIDEYLKIPRIIPQDYEKETVAGFIKELPKLRKAANLVEMYCIDSYLKKAYDKFLDEAPNDEFKSAKKDKSSKLSCFERKVATKDMPKRARLDNDEENMRAKDCEEFMHNLIFGGREKEAELSETRKAEIRAEQKKRDEIYWKKKHEENPVLIENLQTFYEKKFSKEGFANLKDLQSDRYVITMKDIEHADRRRLGLLSLSSNDDIELQPTTSKTLDVGLSSKAMKLRKRNSNKTQQSPQSVQPSTTSYSTPAANNLNIFGRRRPKNYSEEFMKLRAPFKTRVLEPMPTTSETKTLTMQKLQDLSEDFDYDDDNPDFLLRTFRDAELNLGQPSSYQMSSRQEHREYVAPLSANSSMSSVQMQNINCSTQMPPISSTLFRDTSNLSDLPHISHQNALRQQLTAPLAISTPLENSFQHATNANAENIDTTLQSRNADNISPGGRRGIHRLTSIIEQRETLESRPTTDVADIPQTFEDLNRGEEIELLNPAQQEIELVNPAQQEIDLLNPAQQEITENNNNDFTLNPHQHQDQQQQQDQPQQTISENVEVPVEEVEPRNWLEILRRQFGQIDYITPINRNERRRYRRRRRFGQRNRPNNPTLEELLLARDDSLAILPPPPIPFQLEQAEGGNVEHCINELEELSIEPQIQSVDILQRAQERHEEFVFNNMENLTTLMDCPYNLQNIMLEYVEAYKNGDPNLFYAEGPLLSGFTYDVADILETNERDFELKLHIIEEIVKTPFINLHRQSGIKNRQEAIKVFGFLQELKNFGAIEIENNGEKVSLK